MGGDLLLRVGIKLQKSILRRFTLCGQMIHYTNEQNTLYSEAKENTTSLVEQVKELVQEFSLRFGSYLGETL